MSDPQAIRPEPEALAAEYVPRRRRALAVTLTIVCVQALEEGIERHVEHLHTMTRVAGQASVEETNSDIAAADARFSGYCARWAGELAALLASDPQA